MAVIRKKKSAKKTNKFVATCGSGLEQIVEQEIISFGGQDTTVSFGAVSWTGSLESAYRACLWSRFASRILIELKTFPAPDTDSLYNHAINVMWDDHFHQKNTFAVYCTLVKSEISHSQYASLRIKDAVVDQFRKRFGKRPQIDTYTPDIRLHLHVEENVAALSLDLSGDSLHRRGYRGSAGEAPLKETLAAAIVELSGVIPKLKPNDHLIDPMCGSGTLLIEAALMLTNSAPGLLRKKFGFSKWLKHDQKLWEKLVEEALETEKEVTPEKYPTIIGYDADPQVIAMARKNIIAAGMRELITVKQRQLSQLSPPATSGWILTNPPYGDRLSEKLAVKYLYRFIGRKFQRDFMGWKLSFFTGNPDLAAVPTLNWQQKHRLFNGPIKCQLLTGEGVEYKQHPPINWATRTLETETSAQDLANRLQKNCSVRFPWAKENNISCYRIYDRDIPEYNVSIDIYEQWVHIQEYAPPSTIDQDKASERFSQILQIVRELLGAKRSQLFIKTRKKQKGKDQYQKKGGRPVKQESEKLYEVSEGGCKFLVNFTDYLDTGLFLDHRITRSLIAKYAQGKTFLNLFGYTGSATVYAAAGGATSTTTVDISSKYLDRARANLSLNGVGGPLHQIVQSDCLEWLHKETSRFGMIFVDPPTFSNNRHNKTVFDIQKDHTRLLELAMKRLSLSGSLIFSTNSRKFKLAEKLSHQFKVTELTEETIPPDFSKHSPPHKCWLFTHFQDED